MKETVYISSSGEFVKKDNSLLFITTKGEKKFIPVENVKEIFIFGEVDFNKRILDFLSQKEIVVSYFNYYGYYMGSFYPRQHNNSGHVLLKQALAYENNETRIEIAKQFVIGAAKNSLKIMKYYNRREKDLNNQINTVEELLTKIDEQININQLMAVEGQIKKTYYDCFSEIINNEEFSFVRRTKRPPKDYINSLISFSNTIIYNYVLSEIYKTHLDPRIGYLHSTNSRGFTLNLDIAEIFKPVIGDRTIFNVLNKNIITEDSFESDLNGILLKPEAKRKFLEQAEERVKQIIKHSTLETMVSYRRLIRMEIYKLEKHILGEKKYKPFVMDW